MLQKFIVTMATQRLNDSNGQNKYYQTIIPIKFLLIRSQNDRIPNIDEY